MADEDGFIVVTAIVLILGAIVMLIIGPIVIHDYAETKEFARQICSGTELKHLDINDGTVYSKGTIETCVVASSQDQNCTYNVKLFYPPIEHWLLANKKRGDVESWAAGLGASQTFVCYIENPGVDGSEGISAFYDKIAGYIAMTVIAALMMIGIPIFAMVLICC